jgi:hypothetical protein
MKFHLPSYLLGFGTAAVLLGARATFRPVVVELGAVAIQLGRTARVLVERQREALEDLRAEIEERVRARVHRAHANGNGRAAAPVAS